MDGWMESENLAAWGTVDTGGLPPLSLVDVG